MKIQYLGHSSFLFTSGDGTRVVTDPYKGIGYPFPKVCADVVTVSHGHYDHCAVSSVGGDPAVLSAEGEYRVGGWRFTAIRSYHDDVHGRKRGSNLIFRMEADGLILCHLGDVGERCDEEKVRLIGRPDVLFVPVGGNYTIDGAAACEYVRMLRPRFAVPMHYKTPDLTIDIDGPEAFLAGWSAEEIVRAGNVFEPVCGQTEPGKIIVMERDR